MARSQAPAQRWTLPLVTLLIFGWLGLAAASPGAVQAQSQTVAIIDFAFDPATLEVPIGTTVTWTNQGTAPHTVTADDGTFDSGALQPGSTFSVTFDTPGTFAYHCEIHPNMMATIIVTEGAAATPVGAISTGAAAMTPTVEATTAAPAAPAPVAGRPAHIHSGDCVNLGDVVAPLTDLTKPAGQAEGRARA